MKMIANLNIAYVSRWQMDNGNSGGKVFVLDDEPSQDKNEAGRPIIEWYCEHEMLPVFQKYNESYPAYFECEVKQKRGSKGKVTNQIISIKPVTKTAPAPNKT